MICRTGFSCTGPCDARNYAIPDCARMLRDGEGRCDHCPLDRLDAAQASEKGLLIRRALDLMAALKLGVRISLDDIKADEFQAMLIIAEERDLLQREYMRAK